MSKIDINLIRPEPPPADDSLAAEEKLAFEPNAKVPEPEDEYAAAHGKHKIDLLRLAAEEENLKLDRRRIDLEKEKAHVDSLKQDIEARKRYSNKIFTLVSFWLVAILLIVALNSLCFHLTDTVILALIGGTTINVLGLFLVVANYLFPKNGKVPRAEA